MKRKNSVMRCWVFVLILAIVVFTLLFSLQSPLVQEIQAAPESNGTELRILPLGDSITHGGPNHDSYRRPLWQSLGTNGCCIVDFVGSQTKDEPSKDYDPHHEGHFGWTTGMIKVSLPSWLQDYTPDIVLLYLGTNDAQDEDIGDTIDNLKEIITILRSDNPQVTVLIAKLIPTSKPWNTYIRLLNEDIPGIAEDMDSSNSRMIVVDQNSGFDPKEDTYDGIHPNTNGEAKVAQKWFDTLTSKVCGPLKLIEDINTANQSGTSSSVHLDARCGYILTKDNNNTDGLNGLPSITSPIHILGNEATIERRLYGTPGFRIFHVAAEGELVLERLTVRGGDKVAAGGGIYNAGGRVGVFYSTISGNYADKGGGIYNMGRGQVSLTNSTVSGNFAQEGGGICNYGSSVRLTYSTIGKNYAGDGGGIYNHYDAAPLRLTSSIVANNYSGGDCSGYWFESNGYNLDSDGTCGLDADNKNDLPNKDPVFGYLRDNGGPTWTHGLMRNGEGGATKDSPAIDRIPIGANECGEEPISSDQRGEGRPADGNGDGTAGCDIGAFERQEGETAIDLLFFVARPAADRVLLAWETATEVDNAGFNLWRSEAEDGEYVRINETLIPAEGNATSGAAYRYADDDVTRGVTYYYKLEDVNIRGVSTFHGPVSATPGPGGRIVSPSGLK